MNLGPESYALPVKQLSAVHGTLQPGQTSVRLSIQGDCSAPTLTFASSGTGTLVPGKVTQATYSLGAWIGTVTDGSHFLRYKTTQQFWSYSVPLASTSPSLAVIATGSAFVTGGTGYLCPYTTTLTGTFIGGPLSSSSSPFIRLEGVSFGTPTSSVSLSYVVLSGSNFAYTNRLFTTNVFMDADYVGPPTTTAIPQQRHLIFSNNTWGRGLSYCISLVGTWRSVSGVFRHVAGCGVPYALSNSSSADAAAVQPSLEITTLGSVDMEAVGNCMHFSNSIISATGKLTCTTTAGRFMSLHNRSVFSSHSGTAGNISGSVGLPSLLWGGSMAHIRTPGEYTITNTVIPGADFQLGNAPAIAVGSIPASDATSHTQITTEAAGP